MAGQAPTVIAPSLELQPVSNAAVFRPLTVSAMLIWGCGAVLSFHVAYEFFSPIILLFLACMFQLSCTSTRPRAMYSGWLVGLCIYGPQLAFFFGIFGMAAVGLWLVLATWLSIYLVLQRFVLIRLGPQLGAFAAPFIWTGLEYFRGELYYLRFTWLNVGYVMSPFPQTALIPWLGMYGIGFVLMALAAMFPFVSGKTARSRWIWGSYVAILLLVGQAARRPNSSSENNQLRIGGVQLEFADPQTVLKELDKLIVKWPEADLLVLSEYTFDGKVPSAITEWCNKHDKYLVAGGKDYLDAAETQFRNTAFVIGPDGKEVFSQAKQVPIQFFKDGLPAVTQSVWNSPWGKIGFCVCYDLSYTRVIDELIRQRAQLIVVPTMDVQDWGKRQHRLHARVAPVRAAEYGVPIFRLCSSGISQAINSDGRVFSSAGFPGQGEALSAAFILARQKRRVPLDRYLVWPCLGVCASLLTWYFVGSFQGISGKRAESSMNAIG